MQKTEMASLRRNFEDVVRRMAAGDVNAFQDIHDDVTRIVKWRLQCRGRHASDEDIEDIAQDTILSVWKNAASFNPEKGSPTTWIVRIADSRSTDFLRHKNSRIKTVGLEESRAGYDDKGPDLAIEDTASHRFEEQAELAHILDVARKIVRPEIVETLEKTHLRDMKLSEVAKGIDVPLATVKCRLRRAMDVLRDVAGAPALVHKAKKESPQESRPANNLDLVA